MELIKTNDTILNSVPKIVETPRHFSLNSQLYDKLTFRPYPMKFFTRDIARLLSLTTSIDRTVDVFTLHGRNIENTYNDEHNQVNILQDKFDPNVFYSIRPHNIGGMENHIIEKTSYNPDTYEYTILNTVLVSNVLSKNRNCIKLLYENDENLVFFTNGRDVTTSATYYAAGLFILNKKTFSVHTLRSDIDINQYFLASTYDDTIYLARMMNYGQTGSDFTIYKLNISTKEFTQIYKAETTTSIGSRVICNPVKIGDHFYVLHSYPESGVYQYKIMKIAIDFNTDAVTAELFDIDLNGFVLDDTGKMSNTNSLYHTLRVIESNDNTYLSLLIHVGTNTLLSSIFTQCKHALIKMEDDTFTVIDSEPFKDGCFGSLEYTDSKHQVFFTSNAVSTYVFDSTQEKMVLTYQKGGVFAQVGFDSLNRLITYSANNTLEILTEGNSSTLRAYFDKEFYNRTTEDIDAVVSFYAKNFLDEFVDTSVKLTLVGPVIFSENKTQELIISSSSEGIKSVPVTITGYGNIQVIITQNT